MMRDAAGPLVKPAVREGVAFDTAWPSTSRCNHKRHATVPVSDARGSTRYRNSGVGENPRPSCARTPRHGVATLGTGTFRLLSFDFDRPAIDACLLGNSQFQDTILETCRYPVCIQCASDLYAPDKMARAAFPA